MCFYKKISFLKNSYIIRLLIQARGTLLCLEHHQQGKGHKTVSDNSDTEMVHHHASKGSLLGIITQKQTDAAENHFECFLLMECLISTLTKS